MPVKGTDRERVVLALADGELFLEIGEREELVRRIKLLVVLAVAALDLAIVSWSIGTNEFVADAKLGKGGFKEGGQVFWPATRRLVNSVPLSV